MTDMQNMDGVSSAGRRPEDQPKPRGGLRLAAILLTVGAAAVTVIGLPAFAVRFLFPMSLPGAVVQLLEAVALLLVLGAVLSAIAAGLALASRARRVAVCAAGTLAVCLLFIVAGVYLYCDFSLRQRLAARLCRPGYRLTFACQFEDRPDGVQETQSLEAVRLAVAKRLDPRALGTARVVTAPPDKIMVSLDRRAAGHYQENLDRVVRFVEQRGLLEFCILPTTDRGDLSDAEIERYTQALVEKGPEPASDNEYVWVEIKDPNDWHVPNSLRGQFGDKHYVLASNRPGEVMLHQPGETGWRIKNAHAATDEMGRRAIEFTLDQRGGDLFWRLTGRNSGRPLAILIDNVAISAPTINNPIGDKGIIRGTFTATDVSDMVNVLNSDPLPFALQLVENVWQD